MGCEQVVLLKDRFVEGVRESVASELWGGTEGALEQVGAARIGARRCAAEVKKGCGPVEAGGGMHGCLAHDR